MGSQNEEAPETPIAGSHCLQWSEDGFPEKQGGSEAGGQEKGDGDPEQCSEQK